MKKYFLLVALMVVFLGWGNYSMGQDLENGSTTLGGTTPTDYTTPSNTEMPVIPEDINNPIYETETDPNQTNEDSSTDIGSEIKCSPDEKKINGVCEPCSDPDVCCGIELNTSVPFIGKCIEDDKYSTDPTSVSQEEAFPVLMSSLTKILVTVILIVSFVLIIVGGIMIASGNPSGGKKMIIKVVMGIALLGASGVILRLINPNFFG